MGAGRVNVGRFVEHEVDSLFFHDFVHAGVVGRLFDGVLFVAPVAREVDYAVRGADDDGGGAGDRVENVDEFDA